MNKGIVIKSTGKWYTIKDLQNNQILQCSVKGKLRLKGLKSTNPVAVGDYVFYKQIQDNNNQAVINKIEPRKNYIIRKASNLSKQYHLIAANVDLACLMITLKTPKTPLEFVDRFLVTVEAYSIPSLICINKIDIYGDKEKQELRKIEDIYSNIGYPCISVSVEKKVNIESLVHRLKGNISVISGNSGVGKSSLLNMLDPNLNLKTKEISELHKTGKHATTFAEMHELPMGGHVIDTPGIRAFGIIDIEKSELYHFFPEIFNASAGCKFHNCLHINEPDCQVRANVEEGIISHERYKNYLNLYFEDQSKYRTGW